MDIPKILPQTIKKDKLDLIGFNSMSNLKLQRLKRSSSIHDLIDPENNAEQ